MTRTHWTCRDAGVRSRRLKAVRRRKKEHLLLASFLALALDLILSACRFLSSSSVSPEAATTLSSSHQHCQFGHLRTCAQAIQSDTLAGAKKLSNVFIIITFLSYRLPFRSLISSPPPLPPPPARSSPSYLPSLPPCHPLTLVPLLTPHTHPILLLQAPSWIFTPLTATTRFSPTSVGHSEAW